MDEKVLYLIIGVIFLMNIMLIIAVKSSKKKNQMMIPASQQSVTNVENPVHQHAKTEVLGAAKPIETNLHSASDQTELLSDIQPFTDAEKEAFRTGSEDETVLLTPEHAQPKTLGKLIYQENNQEQTILLTSECTIIGRDPNACDVILTADQAVGRSHAILYKKRDAFFLADLNSKNGTFVNGQQVKGQISIEPNTVFTVGKTEIELTLIGG